MVNWRELMTRVRSWLRPDGRFFMHIFTHRSGAYLFDRADGDDWIAQHFFTGGVMPSHHLIRQYADLFEVEKEWRWSGTHYQRTALDWLANFDLHRDEIEDVLREVYGSETALVDAALALVLPRHRGLFGYADGSEWGVSHYRMKAAGQFSEIGVDKAEPPSLPQRLQNLHQLAVDELIAADHIAGLQRIVVAVDARDDAAGFADHDLAGRHVPWLQIAFPIAVEAAGGDEGHVERGGAEPAQARHLVLDLGHFQRATNRDRRARYAAGRRRSRIRRACAGRRRAAAGR